MRYEHITGHSSNEKQNMQADGHFHYNKASHYIRLPVYMLTDHERFRFGYLKLEN